MKKTKRIFSVIFIAVYIAVLANMFAGSAAEPYDKTEVMNYITEQIENCSPVVNVSSFNISRSEYSLFSTITADIPTAFNVKSYSWKYSGGCFTEIDFVYRYTKEEYILLLEQFRENTEYLLRGLRESNLSEETKALIVHDRLVAWCAYDYNNYLNNTIPADSYLAFGVIVNRSAVCAGYARAYTYLLNELGIKSEYVNSKKLDHAWNIVTVDGKRYHTDTTWDDKTPDVNGKVYHENLLRSTDGIKSTNHTGDDYDTTPSDTKYDSYYWQNSQAEFQYFDGALYYINYYTGELIKRIGNQETTITNLDLRWYTASGSYYVGCYSKLCSDDDYLYYSTQDAIYSVDKSDTVKLVYTPGITSGYSIYGFNVYDSYFYIYCYQTPNIGQNPACLKRTYRYSNDNKLTYNYNGGSCGPVSSTGSGDIILSDTEPKRNGYTFIGWSTSESASSAQYQPGDTFNLIQDTTLYAVWKIEEYTLKYNANAGKNPPDDQTGNGNIILSGTKPTRTGYTFKSWNTKADGTGTDYAPGASYYLSADATLYAIWQKDETPGNPQKQDNPDIPGSSVNPTASAKIKVKSDSVYKNSKVTVTAKAEGVPKGYYLAVFDGKTEVERGTNSSVTYEIKELVSRDKKLTVKVIDKDGNVQKNAKGEKLTDTINITVKTGFFDAIIAFFKKLFGSNKAYISV